MSITVDELRDLRENDKATGEHGEWVDVTLIAEAPEGTPPQLSVRPGAGGKTFRVKVANVLPNPDVRDYFDETLVGHWMLNSFGPPQHGDAIPRHSEATEVMYGFHGWLIENIERDLEIDEVVARWQDGRYGESPAQIHDFLGMTFEEYAAHVENNEEPAT